MKTSRVETARLVHDAASALLQVCGNVVRAQVAAPARDRELEQLRKGAAQ